MQVRFWCLQRFCADVISVLGMTMSEGRECLKYRLLGSLEQIGSWGHEYVRWVVGLSTLEPPTVRDCNNSYNQWASGFIILKLECFCSTQGVLVVWLYAASLLRWHRKNMSCRICTSVIGNQVGKKYSFISSSSKHLYILYVDGLICTQLLDWLLHWVLFHHWAEICWRY